jgi:serine O-acetyltransferase
VFEGLLAEVRRDTDSILDRDPAARSRIETMLTYPGLHAVWAYRVAHRLWGQDHRLAARLVSSGARRITGVDIHPAATLGQGLFIDHAVGVVIGETAEVGEDVTIYQGVTLGGTSLERGKRHPTVGDRVVIGAGAKVLGPLLVGDDARIGANSVVVRDVPAGSVVVGVPGQIIARTVAPSSGPPTLNDQPISADPVSASLASLMRRLELLERQVGADEVEMVGPGADGNWRGEDFSI